MVNRDKNRYSSSQKVPQAHPHARIFEEAPTPWVMGRNRRSLGKTYIYIFKGGREGNEDGVEKKKKEKDRR